MSFLRLSNLKSQVARDKTNLLFLLVHSRSWIISLVPKKSYASIVKVKKESPAAFSAPTYAPRRSVSKSQEQPVIAGPPPLLVSETPVSRTNANENSSNKDSEVEGYSIYIKGLPLNVTPSLLENEFKKFVPIKNGGIQVRSQKGFCFGFVEFEAASAVQSAIKESPIDIGGRQAVVEEKRSTSRGNGKGQFSSGRGNGYRNEGGRGRRGNGNYEVAGAMVGVTLMVGLSLEAGVATEKDFQTVEVMDISGLIMQVATVAVQIVLVD
nr:hypothetical protein CFP56_75065 [Quercus suber]